mgnify:CR=1 FL=1
MLRSLVGSEMCIRDRTWLLRLGFIGEEFETAREFLTKNLTGDTAFRFGSCLLYTSDAADDLLCVDLGGRRTIKKKTEHHPSTHLITTLNYTTNP